MITDDATVEVVRESLVIAMRIATPILLSGIIIGLIISIFQSITQIQEMTLTIVPKIFAMTTVAIVLMPWIAMQIADFAVDMFNLM